MQEGKEHLVLGLIWQIIKIGLSSKVDIKVHPELFRLLNPGETLEEFLYVLYRLLLTQCPQYPASCQLTRF